jgi:hypothetical protein
LREGDQRLTRNERSLEALLSRCRFCMIAPVLAR